MSGASRCLDGVVTPTFWPKHGRVGMGPLRAPQLHLCVLYVRIAMYACMYIAVPT